ncbi:hypothetical protein D3C80_1674750 [compost metagenome]
MELPGKHRVGTPPVRTVKARPGQHVDGGRLAVTGLVAIDQLGPHRPGIVEPVPAIERMLLLELAAVGDQP